MAGKNKRTGQRGSNKRSPRRESRHFGQSRDEAHFSGRGKSDRYYSSGGPSKRNGKSER